MLSACLTSFIAIQINALIRNHDVDNKFEALKQYVNFTLLTGDGSTRYLGQLEEVFDYIEEHAARATEIYNTRVVITTNNDDPQANVDLLHLDKIVNVVVNCVNTGVKWNEIISNNGVERVNAVKKRIKTGNHYVVHKMTQEFPITNFVLFEYSGRLREQGQKNEVLFGFGYHQYDVNNEIFVSNDEKLWEFFYNFFRLYRNHYAKRI